MSFKDLLVVQWKKESWTGKDCWIDFGLLALAVVTIFAGDNPIGFGIVGSVFAALLGERIGGGESAHGTLEFILTRPIDRGRWLDSRFLLGLSLLALMLAFFLGAAVLHSHARFGSFFMGAPSLVPDADRSVAWRRISLLIASIYAVAFLLSCRSRSWSWFPAVIGGSLALLCLLMFQGYLVLMRKGQVPSDATDKGFPVDPAILGRFDWLFALFFVGVCWGGARLAFAGKEVLETAAPPRSIAPRSGALWIFVFALLFVVGMAVVWLTLSRVSTH